MENNKIVFSTMGKEDKGENKEKEDEEKNNQKEKEKEKAGRQRGGRYCPEHQYG